jgi:hypothetical protein
MDDVVWHSSIDFASQFNEACAVSEFTRFPGQLKGSIGIQCPPTPGPGFTVLGEGRNQ